MIGLKAKVPVCVLGIFLLSSGVSAFADNYEHRGDVHRHADHYYRNGHWYHHGWFGMEVVETRLPMGVYIDTLPPAYSPVVIQGTTYYYGDNTYLTASPQGGYMVVTAPR